MRMVSVSRSTIHIIHNSYFLVRRQPVVDASSRGRLSFCMPTDTPPGKDFEPPKYLASLIAAINDGAKAAQAGVPVRGASARLHGLNWRLSGNLRRLRLPNPDRTTDCRCDITGTCPAKLANATIQRLPIRCDRPHPCQPHKPASIRGRAVTPLGMPRPVQRQRQD